MKTRTLKIIGIIVLASFIGFFLFMIQSEKADVELMLSKVIFGHDEPITFSFTISHAKNSCTIPNYEIFYEDDIEPTFSKDYMTPFCFEYPFFYQPAKTWNFPLEDEAVTFNKNGIYTLVVRYYDQSASMQFTVTNYPNLLEETDSSE